MKKRKLTIARITENRLQQWAEDLGKHTATPLVLIAIGHGANKGDIVVIVPEYLPAPIGDIVSDVGRRMESEGL